MTGSTTGFTIGNPVWVAVAATVSSVAVGMLLATPAVAADGSDVLLELSGDGVHYAPGTVRDIFVDTRGYVPGDSRPGTVWVRNASPDAARFSLAVANKNHDAGSELPAYLHLRVDTASGATAAAAMPAAGFCSPVIANWTVPSTQSLRLDLGLDLSVDAPNGTRNQESNFDLLFVMQGLGGGEPLSPCAAAAAVLPETGHPAVPPDSVSVGTASVTSRPGRAPHPAGDATATGDEFPPDDEELMGESQVTIWAEGSVGLVPQSNVVATTPSAWLWLLPLAAAMYMVISLRRRRRTQ